MTWIKTDDPHILKWTDPKEPGYESGITVTDAGGHLHLHNRVPGDFETADDDCEWWHPCDPGGVEELRDALTALLDIIEEDPVSCHTRFKPPAPPSAPTPKEE